MIEIKIPVTGSVRYFQRDNITGLIVPGTEHEDHNIIQNDLLNYLSYKIGTDTINQSISNRFTVGGTIDSGDDGYDGIGYSASSPTEALTHKLDTDINAGGDLTELYIEFSGSIAGALNMTGYLQLGHNYDDVPSALFNDLYAYYSISANIEAGRTFYFYWRLTIT